MIKKLFIKSLLFSTVLSTASFANANTYYLNESNVLGNNINYAQVDVVEQFDNLSFTVQALGPLNWKFSNFYFNLVDVIGAVTLTGIPSDWSADTTKNVSEFGKFSNGVKGDGDSLNSFFTFTVDGANALTLVNLGETNKGWIFAGHVQCQNKENSPCAAVDNLTSHHIAGPGISEVPLPAAGWLFGSALLGLMGFRRKM